jgi:hypothetical protein
VPRGTVDGMNINMYVINAILVLMVVRQIREHSLDLQALAVPVLAVGAAACTRTAISALAWLVSATSPSIPAVRRPALRCLACRTLPID